MIMWIKMISIMMHFYSMKFRVLKYYQKDRNSIKTGLYENENKMIKIFKLIFFIIQIKLITKAESFGDIEYL